MAMAHEQTLEGLIEKLSGAKPEKRRKAAIPKYTEHWADLDARFDELVEKGFIEQVRTRDGEPVYRFTDKGLAQTEFAERAKRN